MAYVLIILFCAASLGAQTISGSITGAVLDSSGNVIPAAAVKLTSERTGEERTASTNESGDFLFPALQPGAYTISVEHPGFRPYRKTGNVLSAAERLSVGNIALSVGTVNESITVQAQGVSVQTSSSENSALLSARQIEQISIRGRDVVSMLRILPGVSQTVDTEFLGGSFGTGTPNIGGTRSNWNSLQVDGLTGNDLGSPSVFSSPINMDAIGEVKVLLNNYQAEYGRNGATFINIVTKSGGREYHGSGYWYKRHESWNANDFFNNRQNVRLPVYRYSTIGASLGGPVPVDRLREKAFFFYSFENSWVKNPQAVRLVTTPTALERQGDFTQTLDQNGARIAIRDPLAGAAFPGNVVPASRINRNGQAILNIFPTPNTLDRALTRGNFNHQFQESIDQPRRQHLFRIDLRPSAKDSLNFRGSTWWADSLGYAVAAGSSNWGLVRQHYTYTDDGMVLNYARILSPHMVNEFTGGVRHGVEKGPPESEEELKNVQRSSRGLSTLGQFFPANNGLGIIPQASFGGVPGAAAITYDGRFPLRGADTVFNFSDNLTYTLGGHTFKGGVFYERTRNYEGEQGNYGGNFSFGRDVNNPFDSNYAYSNALLGNFSNYTESQSRPSNEGRKTTAAFFVQDTWKVTRKLTLDYGMRFVWYNQWYHSRLQASAWDPARFDAGRIPTLYRPVNSGGRRAINPLTGEILPAVYIGAFVPGSGDPFNGSVIATDKAYPRGFRDQEHILPEARFGFAYDPFGDGKTAIRAGFGTFHNTVSPGVRGYSQNPPTQVTPQIFYGNLGTFLGTSGTLFPGGTSTFERKAITPVMYQYTFGIQRDIGLATVVNVSYVGNLGRHLQQSRNLNVVPYGARFLPQNADPQNPALPLNDNFFRPYPGWSGITYNEFAGTSNYNSLQATANRRFGRGLSFGVAYTYSKTMDYTDSDGDGVAVYRPIRIWNYGKAGFDQTHIFVANYVWDLPAVSAKVMPNAAGRFLLDGWQLSGITTFSSGLPSGVGFSTVDAFDITGGGDGARIIVTGKAPRDHGQREFSRWFNNDVFARPARGDFGNAPKDVFRRPGINNWDISVFKLFPVGSEKRNLQLRWEMYNAVNHTQFSAVDSTARFDAQGRQVNARFGEVTATRAPRRMQASLRFTF